MTLFTRSIRINDVIRELQTRHKNADLTPVHKAYIFAAQAHRGVVRKSGEPYISHPLAVAYTLAQMSLDPYTVAAGLLHDTVEDTDHTTEQLQKEFGSDIAFLVDGVTKIETAVGKSNKSDLKAETLRKMLIAMARDIRVLLIKLADRLHNIRTLEHMAPEKQQLIAEETLEIYAPLAHRLGINWIKTELEDFSLRYLDPEGYATIDEAVSLGNIDRRDYIETLVNTIRTHLASVGIACTVDGRPKHYYSIYKKIKKQGVAPKELFDLLALRVITKDSTQCYMVLGEIHRLWKAVPNRLKDYITNPKSNLYQSLHTTVIGPGGHKVEFQIRTEEMHKICEEGIAAHWAYKEGVSANTNDTQKFGWLKSLLEGGMEVEDSTEFLNALRRDLYIKEVFVFTPRGDTIELPEDATVLDFAYSIHSEVGDHCNGGLVNGKMVGIKQKLNNGDTVEIITSEKQHPRKDWLKIVQTNKARLRINAYLNKVERDRAIEVGHDLLDKALRTIKKSLDHLSEKEKRELLDHARRPNMDELLRDAGLYRIDIPALLNKTFTDAEELRKQQLEHDRHKDEAVAEGARERSQHSSSGIIVEGVSDVLIRIAQCCHPVPGDEIIGFVTHGRGISVHRQDCKHIEESFPDRLLRADWSQQAFSKSFQSRLSVLCQDKPGVLASISSILGDHEANITNLQMVKKDPKTEQVILDFTIEIKSKEQLTKIRSRLRSLAFVIELQ
ncbi:RelA/SpoT family protein [Chrysiogenes arsenatis]|uniref:RelA/SpoT family protein n=1 Tax=Chrysiogenes arsenatis TaxID=309797 RepID=UPI0004092113|nr:bifunctional (p)ppGpp synthetase/guanosine-3',5'-bis(diphosphate) 3'-pyrophosphohydrolase [Chrysiogenes arsenatis]